MHQLSNTPRGVSLEGVKQFLLNTKLNQNIFLVALLLDDILKFFWRLRCWTAFCISDDIYIYNVNLKNKIYKSNKRPCWTASCISNIIYIFRMLDSIMQKNAAVQQLYIRTVRMLDSIMQKMLLYSSYILEHLGCWTASCKKMLLYSSYILEHLGCWTASCKKMLLYSSIAFAEPWTAAAASVASSEKVSR